MFRGPAGMAVPTVMSRLPAPSVHPHGFELSSSSSGTKLPELKVDISYPHGVQKISESVSR